MTAIEFTAEDWAAIAEAAEAADAGEAKALLYERFRDREPGVHLAALRETDELREGRRITEADRAVVAAGGVVPARDLSRIIEAYSDGTTLERDCPGELTGDVVGAA